ncbi:phytosulfokine receptor 2-like [Triticum dicoccoides]|uniref:phytosulfokine receptor 2-like n=1 Tax=Triticum dicoccoides TaxID=85692 RepID=UPI0018905F5F|nr:phytosulfokine receptor 2-like [Triticum dicoccoides]
MNPMAKCRLLLFLLLPLLLPEARAASCHPDDLRALQGFAGNLSWGGVLLRAAWSGAMCCGWDGVGCDGATGRVTALRLSGRGLVGPIPGASLAGLAQLEELDLGYNGLHNISGAITMLRGCQNLTTLILTRNFGGEELPDDGFIGGFKSLVVLDLGDSAVRGRVPKWLSQCKKMEVLDLSRNQLVGTVPSWIGRLDHLCYLDLSNNTLVGEVPKSSKGLNTTRCSPDNDFTNMSLYLKRSGRSRHRRQHKHAPNVIAGTNNVVRSGSNNVLAGNDNTIIFENDNAVSGSYQVVYGNNHVVTGDNHVVSGSNHAASGSYHVVIGKHNIVSGTHNDVGGSKNIVSGSKNVVSGSHNTVSGKNHFVTGHNKVVT